MNLVCILLDTREYDQSRFQRHVEKLGIKIELSNDCSALTPFTGGSHQANSENTIFISGGSCFPSVLKNMISLQRKDCLVGLDPEWDVSLKQDLYRIEFPVILICGGGESSLSRMQSMKYHDRISKSSLVYVNSDPVKILFNRPERIFKIFEQYMT